MKASRCTFAITDAAAIDADLPSPPITVTCLPLRNDGIALLPSISITGGASTLSLRTARFMASRLACRMLISSISSTVASATANLQICRRRSARTALISGGIIFESSRRHSSSSSGEPDSISGRITAQATTGPARQPRPTSSVPTITECLRCSLSTMRSNSRSRRR